MTQSCAFLDVMVARALLERGFSVGDAARIAGVPESSARLVAQWLKSFQQLVMTTHPSPRAECGWDANGNGQPVDKSKCQPTRLNLRTHSERKHHVADC